MYDYKDSPKTRSRQPRPAYKPPSMVPKGSTTREATRLAVPEAVNDHVPPAPRPSLKVPAPLEVYGEKEKEEPAFDAEPESSDDDEPAASADIPQTIFITTPKKETKTKVLGNVTNGIRGNNIGIFAKELTESPDSKKAKEWEEENRRHLERKKKRSRETKQKLDKSKSFRSKISAASVSANIHAANAKKPVKSRFGVIQCMEHIAD